MATAPAPDRRIAHAAAGRPRCLRRHGLRSLGRPSPPGAAGVRGVQPPARSRSPRPTDRPRTSDRPARRPGALEPGHRTAAVSVSPDDRHTPVPHLPQARDHQPRSASLSPLGAHSIGRTIGGQGQRRPRPRHGARQRRHAFRLTSRPSERAAVSMLSSVVTTRSAPAVVSRPTSSARAMPIAAMPPALAAWTPAGASSVTIA